MKTHRRCAFACIALFALADSLACGGTDEAAQAAPADDALGGQVDGADGAAQPAKTLAYAPCSKASHVGGFRISLAEKFSGVQGQVLDGVVPMKVPEILMSEGTCQLMRAPNPFCSPGCEPGQACKGDGAGGSSGTCIGYPVSHPVGTVTVAGLKAELTMDAKWGNSYINPGTLPHPAFDPGDAITLRASGGDYEAFTLLGRGIAALTAGAGGSDITLEDGKSATLKWQASADTDAVGVHIELNINNHGSSSGWIECESPDSGSFTISGELVTALFALGVSGFPTLTLTRRSVDSTDIAPGCVELVVASELGLGIDVAGVTSCTEDKQCPAGQTCGADLVCG